MSPLSIYLVVAATISFLMQTWKKFLDKLRSTKEKIEGLEKILHTEGSDKKLGYEEWKTELLKYVFTPFYKNSWSQMV